VTSDAASADNVAAYNFILEFKKMIEEEGFLPKQMFDVDEPGILGSVCPTGYILPKKKRVLPVLKHQRIECSYHLGETFQATSRRSLF
jgi:hypothetical protein